MHNMDVLSIKEEDNQAEQVVIKKIDDEQPPSPPMHLSAGSEIDNFDLYGKEIKFDLPCFDDENCGDYYKRMLDEYPSHPLLLKSYASFLEYKGDLKGAEEYYHKCTVVEPSDGVALANYGRLAMQLYKDEAKASSYFERAVQASPEDSNVLAAYASFLWEIDAVDDDEDDDSFEVSTKQRKEDSEPEPEGEHGSRLSETEDGETLCRYAKAFWSIKGDHDEALFYFEKAVEASPNDRYNYKYVISSFTLAVESDHHLLMCMSSIILGEYARFLWEIEER